jgi:hypothetical protein
MISNIAFADAWVSCKEVDRISKIVAEIRGLNFKHPVKCREFDKKKFVEFKRKQFHSFYSSTSLAAEGFLYKLLGIVPSTYDYSKCISDDSFEDVLATYDPESKTIIIPAWNYIPEDIFAHELTHALQDQHFKLGKLMNAANNSTDNALSMSALAEGDALLVQEIFRNKYKPGEVKKVGNEKKVERPDCSLPDILQDIYEFPYVYGLAYVKQKVNVEGTAGVNKLFKNPPCSTSQIMHKNLQRKFSCNQKYYSDHSKFRDTLGQYFIMKIFKNKLSDLVSLRASKGWVNDLVEVNFNHNKYNVSWQTEWETEEDSKEFISAIIMNFSQKFNIKLDSGVGLIEFHLPDRSDYFFKRYGKQVNLKINAFTSP